MHGMRTIINYWLGCNNRNRPDDVIHLVEKAWGPTVIRCVCYNEICLGYNRNRHDDSSF